jgi:DNA modification methylase
MIEIDQIYNEDCLEGMKRIDDGSVDCIITDIPYNEVNRSDNGLRNLDKKGADIGQFDANDLTRTLCAKTKGSVYMFCGINQVSDIRVTMTDCGLSTRLLIWEKTNPSPMNGDKIWLSGIECCVYGKKSGAVFNEFCKNVVFRYPSGDSNVHPTQKPLDLMRRFVLASTKVGGVVLDPFIGSGTTAIACLKEHRHFLGFELNKEYFDIAQRRIALERQQPQLDFTEDSL